MAHLLSSILKEKGSEVCTLPGDTSVVDAITKMCELNIGSIVVMQDDKVAGLFTEREIVRRVYLNEMDLKTTPIAEVMNKDIVTVGADATVEEAMTIFTDKRTRHIPMVEDEVLLGIISIGDVTKWIIDQQQNEIEHLSNYIQGDHH